jgi:hypothetical protein
VTRSVDPEALDDAPGEEIEAVEEQIAGHARHQTIAAATLAELEAEIAIFRDLEERALGIPELHRAGSSEWFFRKSMTRNVLNRADSPR